MGWHSGTGRHYNDPRRKEAFVPREDKSHDLFPTQSPLKSPAKARATPGKGHHILQHFADTAAHLPENWSK